MVVLTLLCNQSFTLSDLLHLLNNQGFRLECSQNTTLKLQILLLCVRGTLLNIIAYFSDLTNTTCYLHVYFLFLCFKYPSLFYDYYSVLCYSPGTL